ncbi:MAG: hypothetical protein R6T93_08985 [Trueperaceae bacterium]
MIGEAGAPDALPALEVLRVDPRLLDVVASLFWATFPDRRLGRADPDADGRVALSTDAPWPPAAAERWRAALDELLRQPFARAGGAYLREVRDRAGRRDELALPVSPDAYGGGAWLVGPFPDEAAADEWAGRALRPPWVHDLHRYADDWYADVFLGDPQA